MRMAITQFPSRGLAVLGTLLALGLTSLLASPARAETPAAVPTETVAAVAETATGVATEAAPVETSASAPEPPSVAAPESAPAPAPVAEASTQVKEVVEETGSAAAAPLESVTETASVRPAVDEVVGGVRPAVDQVAGSVRPAVDEVVGNVRPAVDKVAGTVRPAVDQVVGSVRPAVERTVGSVPSAEQLPGPMLPGLAPIAPFSTSPRGESALASEAETPAPLPGPALPHGDEARPTFAEPMPLATRPAAGWIDGLNLRELFTRAAPTGPPALGAPIEPSIDSPGANAASHASSPDPAHPSPFDSPGPAPGLPTSASPGPGSGSFFVPIAALLALLALTAPAISRRWKGALAAPVPSLFVCALERPG